jgi:transposase
MARVARFEDGTVAEARRIVTCTDDARELRQALGVVLSAVGGLTNEAIGSILGVGVATVVRNQAELRRRSAPGVAVVRPAWGGRRRQVLRIEEEKEFLAPWTAQAAQGAVLVVPPIHRALEERLGHRVAASTAYRILARHGWRKLEPEPHHPGRDPQAQEAFKKAGRRSWRKLVE